MADYTYGNSTNDYVEIADPTTAGQTIRPASGTVVLVRDAETLADLPSTATELYGYLNFTATAPVIRVSADAWVSYRVLYGEEGLRGAVRAGVDASQAASDAGLALSKVNTLDVRVGALEAGGGTGTGGGTAFSGTVDWVTQVLNKPPLTAAALNALPASARGAANGVVPTDASNVAPIAFLPVGTGAAQVAAGAHSHAIDFASLPGAAGVRSVIEIDETSPGVYPTLTAAQARTSIKRVWNGTIRPTAAQGLQPRDKWVNEGAA